MSFKSALRPLKRALAAPVERLWQPLIAGWERADSGTDLAWTPAHGRVLVVAPHPDDEAIGCAGTILRHVGSGDPVCIAIATDGRRSRALDDAERMARLRQAEAAHCAGLLGAELQWIGLPEGNWQAGELAAALTALCTRLDPQVVYAPSRIDFHPEHHAVAHALALALAAAGSRAMVRVYQVQVPLTPRLARLSVDVSSVAARRAAALDAYASQASSIVSAERLRRYCGRARGSPSVECFWQMPAARYVALHGEPPQTWPRAFRGLRNFPLSDPLAWTTGTAERRRIAAPL